jgi:hypothetical protein
MIHHSREFSTSLIGWAKRGALVAVAAAALWAGSAPGFAQEPPDRPFAYDISWPQCPATFPQGEFDFAVIGLNNGYPFSTNDCFRVQYEWAKTAEANPDVYINFDFPSPGEASAIDGPYGRCAETDRWCRAYNHGYAIGQDSIARAAYFGISPGRYWFDVEMINDWSNWPAANGQVVNGAVDYFLEHNIPFGIYGTRYQWGLITGHYMPPVTVPLWVAGATTIEMARERCADETFGFAGGVIWMVQYPQDGFDGNVLCEPGFADRDSRQPGMVAATAAGTEPIRQLSARLELRDVAAIERRRWWVDPGLGEVRALSRFSIRTIVVSDGTREPE